MTELPYINGKTIKTIATIGSDGSIDEVRITHSDGSILIITGEYIRVRLEQAALTSSASSVSSGLAARALEEAWNEGKAIEIPSLGIKITARSVWPGE